MSLWEFILAGVLVPAVVALVVSLSLSWLMWWLEEGRHDRWDR